MLLSEECALPAHPPSSAIMTICVTGSGTRQDVETVNKRKAKNFIFYLSLSLVWVRVRARSSVFSSARKIASCVLVRSSALRSIPAFSCSLPLKAFSIPCSCAIFRCSFRLIHRGPTRRPEPFVQNLVLYLFVVDL